MVKQTTEAEENKTERLGGENKTESETIPQKCTQEGGGDNPELCRGEQPSKNGRETRKNERE